MIQLMILRFSCNHASDATLYGFKYFLQLLRLNVSLNLCFEFFNFRERFIPLTRHSTVALLLKDEDKLTAAEKRDFERFALALDSVISMKYDSSVQELKV